MYIGLHGNLEGWAERRDTSHGASKADEIPNAVNRLSC